MTIELKDNKVILDQLGYSLDDKSVFVDSDGYLDVLIGDCLSVGATSDCSNITIHTYKRNILELDLSDWIKGIISMKMHVSTKTHEENVYDQYDIVLKLYHDRLYKYMKKANSNDQKLLFSISDSEYNANNIMECINDTLIRNEEKIDEVDINKVIEIISKAIEPLLKEFITYAKARNVYEWTLAYQMNDKRTIEVITSDHGLKLKKLNIYEKPTPTPWISSGRVGDNDWRFK